MYILPLVIGFALSGCEAIEVGALPPPTLDIAGVYPSEGSFHYGAPGSAYNAQEIATTDYINVRGSVSPPTGDIIGFDQNIPMNMLELHNPLMPIHVYFVPFLSSEHKYKFNL